MTDASDYHTHFKKKLRCEGDMDKIMNLAEALEVPTSFFTVYQISSS